MSRVRRDEHGKILTIVLPPGWVRLGEKRARIDWPTRGELAVCIAVLIVAAMVDCARNIMWLATRPAVALWEMWRSK